MDPLCRLSATQLAARIASKAVSSRQVVEAHLARIRDVNGHVNAVTVVLEESALAAADAADRSAPKGPLHGVPFTVKESIDCVGSPTTHGIPALRHNLPWQDAPGVERLKQAGAILLGRTNTPEFALRLCTDNPLRGATLNPWNPRLTPGGSTGGEAAALATGMTPLGLGTDMGGSLRSPAYCCGVAALKPTLGRVARASSLPPLDFGMALQAMAVDGPMARSVADLRLALAVLSGRDVRDPRSVDVPLHGPAPATRRAALVLRLPGVKIPAATVSAIQHAGALLAAAGWEVELKEPPELPRVADTWLNLFAVDFLEQLPGLRPLVTRPVYDHLERLCSMNDVQDLPNAEIHASRSFLTRLWSEFFVRYPVVVAPTWTRLPWPVDADLDPDTGLQTLLETTPFLLPANALGLPALALPMGVVDGLPTGVQVFADLWRDDLCLEAAAVIEAGVTMPTPVDPVR